MSERKLDCKSRSALSQKVKEPRYLLVKNRNERSKQKRPACNAHVFMPFSQNAQQKNADAITQIPETPCFAMSHLELGRSKPLRLDIELDIFPRNPEIIVVYQQLLTIK